LFRHSEENALVFIVSGLKQFGAVEQEGDGAVVEAGDVHVFAEGALLDGDALLGDQSDNLFVKRFGQLWLSGGIKAGSAAFAAIAVEREIADEQNRASDVLDASVHFAGFIREDSQVHELVGHELGIGFSVALADAKENEQSPFDFTNGLALNLNFRL